MKKYTALTQPIPVIQPGVGVVGGHLSLFERMAHVAHDEAAFYKEAKMQGRVGDQYDSFNRVRMIIMTQINASGQFFYPSKQGDLLASGGEQNTRLAHVKYAQMLAHYGVVHTAERHDIDPSVTQKSPAEALKHFLTIPAQIIECRSALFLCDHLAYLILEGDHAYNQIIATHLQEKIDLCIIPFKGVIEGADEIDNGEDPEIFIEAAHTVYCQGVPDYISFFPSREYQGFNLYKDGELYIAFDDEPPFDPQPLSYYEQLLIKDAAKPLLFYDLYIITQKDQDQRVIEALEEENGEKFQDYKDLDYEECFRNGTIYEPTNLYAPKYIRESDIVGITTTYEISRINRLSSNS